MVVVPFLVSLLPILSVNSVNVLVYSPAFAASHTNFMARLADTLTETGHNVTFLVPIVDVARRNQLGVRVTTDVIVVEKDEDTVRESVPFDENMGVYWTEDTDSSNVVQSFKWFFDGMALGCDNFLRHRPVLDHLKSRHFDVVIVEPLSVCGLGLAAELGIAKTILASSCAYYNAVLAHIGESEEHSSLPSLVSMSGEKMDFWQRFENYRVAEGMTEGFVKMFDAEQESFRKHFRKEIPDWRELLPAASVFFVNSNPYLDFPRPVLQKTVPIGGISVDMKKIKSQKLSEEWDEILSRREQNMLISFGSMVKSSEMPVEWKRNLLEVIKSEPNVTFIWKYESEDVSFAAGIENVVFSKWVPQPALLNDPRLTAFLTHGGLGSTNELAHCGKPAVMVPIFGDQYRNAHMLERHGGVIVIRKTFLSDLGLIRKAIHAVIFDKKFQESAVQLADLLENQPVNPRELVVKHTEFVAKYGPFVQMDPFGRRLNFFQRHLLDVYLIEYLGQLLFLLILVYLVPLRLRRLLIKKH